LLSENENHDDGTNKDKKEIDVTEEIKKETA
jgi:hypothetical protein